MNKKSFFTLILILVHSSLNSLIPATRDLIIIFDCDTENINRLLSNDTFDQGNSSGATTMIEGLMHAMRQEAAPILVPASLLDFTLACKKLYTDTLSLKEPELLKKYRSSRFSSEQDITHFKRMLESPMSSSSEKSFYMTCNTIKFEKFVIKKFTQHIEADKHIFYLIIPHSYLVKYGSTDKSLGLQIEKNPTVTASDISLSPTTIHKNCSTGLEGLLPSLFVTIPKAALKTQDYTIMKDYPFIWAIVLEGHGSFAQANLIKLEEERPRRSAYLQEIKKAHEEYTKFLEESALKEIALKAAIERTLKAGWGPNIEITRGNLESFKIWFAKTKVILLDNNTIAEGNLKSFDKFLTELAESSSIAGMRMPDFKNFLRFLNNRITTSILVYSSCSAGGQNFVDPFKEEASDALLNLKYTVVAASATEAISAQSATYANYNAFFSALHKELPEAPQERLKTPRKSLTIPEKERLQALELSYIKSLSSLEKIVAYVVEIPHESSGKTINIKTLPSIRLPGSSWVNVPDINKNIYSLTKTKAIAQGLKPLVLKDKKVILLAPQEIDFELSVKCPSSMRPSAASPSIIESTFSFPVVISQQPGRAFHVFKKITTNCPLDEVIKGFLALQFTASKLFLIKNLICGTTNYFNVIIFFNAPAPKVFKDDPVKLMNGIIVSDLIKTKGQLWDSDSFGSAVLPSTIELTECPDLKNIQQDVFKYFDVPKASSQKSVLVGQKIASALFKKEAMHTKITMNMLAQSLHLLGQKISKK